MADIQQELSSKIYDAASEEIRRRIYDVAVQVAGAVQHQATFVEPEDWAVDFLTNAAQALTMADAARRFLLAHNFGQATVEVALAACLMERMPRDASLKHVQTRTGATHEY
jgi:hypothetical protein